MVNQRVAKVKTWVDRRYTPAVYYHVIKLFYIQSLKLPQKAIALLQSDRKPPLLAFHICGPTVTEYIDLALVVDADQHRKTSINQFKVFLSFLWDDAVLF